MDTESAIARIFAQYPPRTVYSFKDASGYILYIFGSMDLKYSTDLQELLLWMVENQEGQSRLIVDLKGVDYISSTGIGALTNAMIQAKKRGLAFLLRNIQANVRAVFVLLGLMGFFDEEKTDE